MVNRTAGNRYRNNHVEARSENVIQHISYGNSENSDSDCEEDYQEGIPHVRRT